MKLTLLAVGRMKAGPERDLVDDYLARLRRMAPGIGFRKVTELEIAEGSGLAAEGERILAKLPGDAVSVRLDEHGEALGSTGLAGRLADWRDGGTPEAVFLIGGAAGYSDAVRDTVRRTLAFGPQTWPHRLVRAMLAEQLYRAATILAGTPYHKG